MHTNLKRIFSALLVVCLCLALFPSISDTAVSAAGLSLSQLRAKFPNGKYWNGGNADSYTSTPCTHHGNCSYTGSCGCNSFLGLSIQCMGYAEKLGYDATGYNPRNNANGWYTNHSSSAIDNLKPGDIVRYLSDTHSIYITGVNGDTVTYTDCNYMNTCVIRWDVTTTKTALKSSFSYVRTAPFSMEQVNYVDLGTSFYANIIHISSGKYVTNDQNNISIRSESGSNNQIWHFERQSDGSYSIISALDSQCMDVTDFGTTSGTNVGPCNYSGNTAQLWYITGSSESCNLRPKCNNLVLDVNGNASADGTNVQVWEFQGSDAQYFEINILKNYTETPTVTLDTNGGDCNIDAMAVTVGSAYGTLPTPTRTGYSFDGWFTEAEGGTEVTSDTTVTIAADHTLYAHWSVNTYTVTFKNWDGTVLKTETVNYGEAATAPTVHERYGYTFTGWDNSFDSVTSNIEINALFEKTVESFFEFNDDAELIDIGINEADGSISFGNGCMNVYSIKALFKDAELSFVKSSGDAQTSGNVGTGTVITSTKNGISKSFTVVVMGDVTGDGRITAADYNKIISGVKGSTSLDGAFFAAANVASPSVDRLTAADYAMIKSYIAGKTPDFETTISRYVYFNANGGEVDTDSKFLKQNSTLGELPVPTRDGFTFLGWFTEDGTELTKDTVFTATNDLTLRARWQSGWVKATDMPANSSVADKKWTYDALTKISSDSATAPEGYTEYQEPTWVWGEYGDWTDWSTESVTASDSRQVETQTITDKEGYTNYRYWIYRSADHKTFGTYGYNGVCYEYHEINLNYQLSLVDSGNGLYGYYGTGCSHSWCNTWFFGEATQIPAETHNEYRYRDRSEVYTYYYQMAEAMESKVEIAPSDTVANVVEWVKYVVE